MIRRLEKSVLRVSVVVLAQLPVLGFAGGKNVTKGGWDLNPNLSDICARVQDDLLERNYPAFGAALRQCMSENPTDAALQESMLALLNQAYLMTSGQLDVEDRLPSEIQEMSISSQIVSGSAGARIKLKFKPEAGHSVRELALVNLAGERIVALNDPLGETEREEDGGIAVARRYSRALPDGLYQLQIATDAKAVVTVPVPIVGWNATAFPQIVSPAKGEKVASGNPTLAWTASPQPLTGFKGHFLHAAAFRSEPPGFNWMKQWQSVGLRWDAKTIEVGSQTAGVGKQSLIPGRYVAWLSMNETRKFGRVRIVRSSAANNNFFVE